MKSLLKANLMRSRYLVILGAFLASLVSGCQTMEGAGEDVQSAGEAIEESSEDVQN